MPASLPPGPCDQPVCPQMIPTLLNFALPFATSYAEEQEAIILRDGVPLTDEQGHDAELAGVKDPKRVRILKVDTIPTPTQPLLAKANEYVGMINPRSTTVTYGFGICIRQDFWNQRAVVFHELVHVSQYERLGGIQAFLKAYLKECMTVGHADSPLEREAVDRTKQICGPR